ncbi:cytochrome P450 [Saccharothrix obliqua]|uniref:cytochrome P450 n=1 Tax=Saccharothrix obliqua TaxID=2861747 RepID=UPI001C5D405E|nr:cytochrome P450 [Saccharothrix obliqua]MBW4720308.1 cytochrome P450 [Saccharothrix obliqua]
MKLGEMRRFRRDPYAYIEDLRLREPGVARLPWGGWCVSDPELAQALLRAHEFNGDRSGFFGELLPSRSAQVVVGRAVRDAVRERVGEYRARLAVEVAALPATTRWPATGTRLVHRCLADVLLHPADAPPEVRRLLADAVRGGVLLRAPRVWQRARAELLRGRLVAALTELVARRRADRGQRDVLDAVLAAAPAELPDRAAAELYVLLFRSVVAPVGCSLAWSVLLACLHHPDGPWPWPADWVVREALRHRPMAWMVGRTVPRPTEFGGIPFPAGEVLSVSPYLLHHDEHRWPEAAAFRPERWGDGGARGPYLPFGAGPFTCAGASVAQLLVAEALTALGEHAHLSVTGGDTRPVMADGAVPRPFTLHRRP